MSNQDLIDQLKKYAGVEAFSIGFRMMLEKAANIIAAHEKRPEPPLDVLQNGKHFWDSRYGLARRTLDRLGNIPDGVHVNVVDDNVMVEDDTTGLSFLVTREEFIDGVYRTAITERYAELMRRRKDDGLGAPENPAV